ncbi:hypothetical protein M9458_039359, partial [Cirrhinus mrigala]
MCVCDRRPDLYKHEHRNTSCIGSLTELVNAFKAAFQFTPTLPSASGSPMAMPTTFAGEAAETATGTLTTSDQLFGLQQGSSLVNDYTLHFCTLAAASGWNEIALLGAYRQGLNPDIRATMALYDDSIGLESFLQRTTRVSQWLATCQPSVTAPQFASVAASFPTLLSFHAPNVIAPSQMDYVCSVDNLDIAYVPAPSDPHAR